MPLYDYRCGACGAEHEIRQKIADDPATWCPSCKADALERLVSRSSFALKGSGWYADGYGDSKPSSSPADKASGAESGSEGKTSGGDSTDKKPAASDTKTPAKSETKSSSTTD